jgi:hypothetical protein
MIDNASLSAEWLAEKRRQYKKDPGIMEGMIHALYLLDQLKLTGLDFIFKGGTSLILLMKKPLRFSVDIDVIVRPDLRREELEEYLSRIIMNSEFLRMEIDERRSYKEGIPKAHYKFIYRSNVSTKSKAGEIVTHPEKEILLDVLFAENPYPVLVERKIQTDWIKMTGEPLTVVTPDINSIAGDKLVAFAPTTTGVPYGAAKEREIIKQLFDVGNLFDLLVDIEIFKKSYRMSAEGEIKHRPDRKISSIEDILRDTIATGIIIARREFHDKDDSESKTKFLEINTGISQFSHFVFEGNFRIDHAQVASAKASYLSAMILTGYNGNLTKFDSAIKMQEYLISHPKYNFLNKRLKFVANGEALFYWHQTLKLLYPDQT